MYACLDCGSVFEVPKRFVETHGLDTPPYEEWMGCPNCAGAFVKTHKCDCCNEWITGEYVKTDDYQRFCENCFCHYELGEEM